MLQKNAAPPDNRVRVDCLGVRKSTITIVKADSAPHIKQHQRLWINVSTRNLMGMNVSPLQSEECLLASLVCLFQGAFIYSVAMGNV